MPDLVFSTKGAQQVAQAYGKLQGAQKKLSDETEKGEQKAAKAISQRIDQLKLTGAEARKLDQLQQQIARRNETAEERYQRKLAETRKALIGHKDETKLLAKETTRLKIERLKSEDAGKRSSEEQARAMAKASRKAQTLQGDVRQIGKGFKSAGDQAGGVGAAIGAWGSKLAIASTAIRLISTEMKNQQALIDKRTATQLSLSESRNVLLRNLVGSSDADIAKTQAAAERISLDTGVSEKFINVGLAEAISASGGDVDASIAAVQASAKFLPDQPAEVGRFAGTLLDLAKVTGTTDAETNLGLLGLVGKQGRVVDPKLQADNIAPALIGAKGFGFDARGAGALAAALSNAASDKTGAISGTGTIQLAKQLSEFNPEELAGLSGTAKLQALQGNRELAEQFLADASFETKVLAPIQQLLLDPNSQAAQQFSQNLAAIPGNAGLNQFGEQAFEIFRKNSLNLVAERKRAIEVALESAQKQSGKTGFISKEERELLTTLGTELGDQGVEADAIDFLINLKGGGRTSTESVLGNLRRLRTEQTVVIDPLRAFGPRKQTPETQANIELIDRLIATLEKTEETRKAQQEKANALLQETRDAVKDGGLTAGGD